MKVEVTEEQAIERDIPECESFELDGHIYELVDHDDHVDEHRWNYTDWYIFKRDDDKLFAHPYDWGLTESQENGYIYSKCELFEVEPHQITRTEYKRVEL